jgi:hypothetical protein
VSNHNQCKIVEFNKSNWTAKTTLGKIHEKNMKKMKNKKITPIGDTAQAMNAK